MIRNLIDQFMLVNQLLTKILEPWIDLSIYLFNGAFIALFVNLSFLFASQEVIINYSLLQELFKDVALFLFSSTFLCLISRFYPFSKQFSMGCLLLLIGFLSIYV